MGFGVRGRRCRPAERRLDDTVRHGKLVTVDAAFLIATLMAAVVLGAQAWLHFNPKPVGTRDPNATVARIAIFAAASSPATSSVGSASA